MVALYSSDLALTIVSVVLLCRLSSMERPASRPLPRPHGRGSSGFLIMISHCSDDGPLLQPLRNVFRAGLRVQAGQILCTSLSGSKLPFGIRTDDALRDELASIPAFVALITPRSVESKWVLCEMSSRWASKRPIAPLVAAGGCLDSLPEPLQAHNALTCDEAADIHQMIREIGALLGIQPEPPDVYQAEVSALVQCSKRMTRARAHRRGAGLKMGGATRPPLGKPLQ